MHADWSAAMRPLLGDRCAPMIVRRPAFPQGTSTDVGARQRAFAGLHAIAEDAMRTALVCAGDRIEAIAFADADAVVLAAAGGRQPVPYSTGMRLFEEAEPAAALRRGHPVVFVNHAPGGSDLLLPVRDDRTAALRALLALRCGIDPPPPFALALALQTMRLVTAAVDLDAVRAHYEGVIGTIGHELRQPLSALVTALDLIELTSAEITRPFEVAQRQTRQLIRLVDAVLDASRLSRNSLTLVPRRLDLRDVLHAALESVQDAITATRQRLDVEVPDRPVRCVADAARLQQVFVNLLTNANRYTPPLGTIAVRVAEAAGEIVVRVADTGIGLDPAAHDRIFTAFTQESSGAREGLGLGLAISRGIVEGHSGSLAVESAGAGCGSTFVVRLPAARRAVRSGLRSRPVRDDARRQAR